MLTSFEDGICLIQATEAKAHLAQLLSAVERGERFAITRHGKMVAHLVPASSGDAQTRREAVSRFRDKRQKWSKATFSHAEILAARHEGHRV